VESVERAAEIPAEERFRDFVEFAINSIEDEIEPLCGSTLKDRAQAQIEFKGRLERLRGILGEAIDDGKIRSVVAGLQRLADPSKNPFFAGQPKGVDAKTRSDIATNCCFHLGRIVDALADLRESEREGWDAISQFRAGVDEMFDDVAVIFGLDREGSDEQGPDAASEEETDERTERAYDRRGSRGGPERTDGSYDRKVSRNGIKQTGAAFDRRSQRDGNERPDGASDRRGSRDGNQKTGTGFDRRSQRDANEKTEGGLDGRVQKDANIQRFEGEKRPERDATGQIRVQKTVGGKPKKGKVVKKEEKTAPRRRLEGESRGPVSPMVELHDLQHEIEELWTEASRNYAEIQEYEERKNLPPSLVDERRHRRYVEKYYENVRLRQTIKLLTESGESLNRDLSSWRSINNDLEAGRTTQTVLLSNDQLEAELRDLSADLKKAEEELEAARTARKQTTQLDQKRATKDDLALAWRTLVVETQCFEQAVTEIDEFALALQSRISELKEFAPPPPGEVRDDAGIAKQVRDFRAERAAELEEAKRNRGKVIAVPQVGRVQVPDRMRIADEKPEKLLQAEERVAISRKLSKQLTDYANAAARTTLSAELDLTQATIEFYRAQLLMRQKQIGYGIPQLAVSRLEEALGQIAAKEAATKQIPGLFDAVFGEYLIDKRAGFTQNIRRIGQFLLSPRRHV
jgi:hypothetical protein